MSGHRSGSLRQSNKAHKSRHVSKRAVAKRGGRAIGAMGALEQPGRRSVKAHTKAGASMGTKRKRLNRAKQMRAAKRAAMMEARRLGGGVEGGPPRSVALVSLAGDADDGYVRDALVEAADASFPSDFGQATTLIFRKMKMRLTVMTAPRDLAGVLDMAKVADVLAVVLPMGDGEDNCVDDDGAHFLSMLKAQGPPAVLGIVSGLDGMPPASAKKLHKYARRVMEAEFSEGFKLADASNMSGLLRTLCSLRPMPPVWREQRSYMLVQAVEVVENGEVDDDEQPLVTLRLGGYLRGRFLSVHQLMHVTGLGTFQMSGLESGADPCPARPRREEGKAPHRMEPDASLIEPLESEVPYDPFAAEQTWPTEEELAEADKRTLVRVPKGATDTQAAWLEAVGDVEAVEGSDIATAMDMEGDDGDCAVDAGVEEAKAVAAEIAAGHAAAAAAGVDADDYDSDDELFNISLPEDELAGLDEERRRARMLVDDSSFPDEIDTPVEGNAYNHFARYKGLQSFRASEWNPLWNLPAPYSRIFRFADMPRTMKAVLGEERGPDSFLPGRFVTCELARVPAAAFADMDAARPLLLSSLLKYENRMSVVNFKLQRTSNYEEPIRSYDTLWFHCGFRRFHARPMFSEMNLQGDKHKYQRFFRPGGFWAASVYAPISFPPAPVLAFLPDSDATLVARGSLLSVNPDRIVLKKIVLSGYPYAVHKKTSVVRFMFFNPEDVQYFKSVELRTKHGRVGHIRESVGLHGYMKCMFDKPIMQHDTVLMALYRRVFPKMLKDDDALSVAPRLRDIDDELLEVDMDEAPAAVEAVDEDDL
eukprot:PLAT11863.1.p1 GENE.PLAT11863.1~~PLAT11863.1.p1  ORF type:complete len:818 (+),score=377.35 PLAT11863.1:49-2502(+)